MVSRGDELPFAVIFRERQWTPHSSNPQDTMADNRQWRSAASSRFPKRIASGSRTAQVTAASAKQSHDRYLELAREAQRVGDKVEVQNYLQHAEHFFRVMRELSTPKQTAP